MARIKLGGIISDIRGSIGGTTFSKFRQSVIMKTKAKQPRANSFYRNRFLNYSRTVAGMYRDLPANEFQNWENYAAYRNSTGGKEFPTVRSGFDWFRSLNFYRVAGSYDPILTPIFNSYDIEPLSIVSVSGTYPNEVEVSRTLVSADEFYVFKASLPILNSWRNVAGKMKVIVIGSANSEFFDIGGEYTARFGVELQSGDKICASVSVFSLGTGFYYPFSPQIIELS